MNSDCEQQCRDFIATLLTPKMVGKILDVTPHHVTYLSKVMGVGTIIGHLRLFTPEDVREMERYRAANPQGRNSQMRRRVRDAEERIRPPVILGTHYQDAIRKLRGEKA